MSKRTYDQSRPVLPAELRRAVEVESGHACAIGRCGEHTYLEVHHINGNREDNWLENLILVCDKHHKMAHSGVIDRKSLDQYKSALMREHLSALADRVARLEELLAAQPKIPQETAAPPPDHARNPRDNGLPTLTFGSSAALSAQTLEQLALARFEKDRGLHVLRGATLAKSGSRLFLDALYQSPAGANDLLIEVRWIRKLYLDAPIFVQQVSAATEAYDLLTGRNAKGVLILVTPDRPWANLAGLSQTSDELSRVSRPPEVLVYTYEQLGYVPSGLSADVWVERQATHAAPTKPKVDG